MKGKRKRELRTAKFKEREVQRVLAGEPVTRLSRELKVKRSLLYRGREAYRQQGVAGLRPIGRPGWSVANKQKEAEARIAALEGKTGQQTMVIDFFAYQRCTQTTLSCNIVLSYNRLKIRGTGLVDRMLFISRPTDRTRAVLFEGGCYNEAACASYSSQS